ncbi:MAG: hypothetical protein AB203_01285 [Parcubacteria bacterium C7867-008]|nr:MAG: hypothetical protein AB203_01285 [Parcubacteria bacterium C7867-008]
MKVSYGVFPGDTYAVNALTRLRELISTGTSEGSAAHLSECLITDSDDVTPDMVVFLTPKKLEFAGRYFRVLQLANKQSQNRGRFLDLVPEHAHIATRFVFVNQGANQLQRDQRTGTLKADIALMGVHGTFGGCQLRRSAVASMVKGQHDRMRPPYFVSV